MKFRKTIFKTIAAAVAALGILSTDAVAQIAGPAPTTSSAFRMYNSGSNWITIAAGPTAGTGTFLWPAVSAGVFKSDATGTMSIGQITATDLALTQNSMFVGGPGNTAIELAAGTAGQVLQIVGGSPTWSTINTLPNGGGNGQTLYWDGDSWESTNSVNVDVTTGAVTINDDLTVSTGNNVVLPNGVINNNELENDDINLSYGTGITGDASVVLGGTLNLQNTGVTGITAGNGISVSGATGNVTVTNTGILSILGTANQVNVSTVAGVATLSTPQDIDQNATPTFDGLILDNLNGSSSSTEVLVINGSDQIETRAMNILPNGGVNHSTLSWNGTAWVFNNNLLANATTGDLSTSASGSTTFNNATTVNSADFNLPSTPTTATTLTTENVLIVDPAGNVTETSPSNIIGSANLPQNNIYVGDASNHPAAVAPGSNGQVLQILGTTPTWQTVNLLPTGSADHNTLVWDLASGTWVENAAVKMDNATGDIITIGDVSAVDGSFSGNATINGNSTFGNAAGDQVTINASTVVTPNLPTTAGPLLPAHNVLITDATGNVTETTPDNIVGAATLSQNNIYVGDATNHPAAVAPGSTGDVLTINGSGTPTWSTPAGTIAAKGQVTGTGTWTYTVNPGINPSGSAIIMVTLTSSNGLQVTNVVNNITATTFDVQFPVNIGATETFHWMIIK